jgi:hypothetical protein
MNSKISKIGIAIIISIFLFIGLKGFFVSVYNQEKLQIYQNKTETGEINTIYVVPNNYLIVKKQYEEQYEYGIFYIRGSNATHYIGPIYSTGKSLLGLRIYPSSNEVWKAEMELIGKSGNLQVSTFEDIGEKFNQLMIFRDNSIELGNLEYESIDITSLDEIFAKSIIDPLRRKVK